MLRACRIGALVCAAVAVVIVIVAWARARPELTEQDAIDFTEQALSDAGFEEVEVDPSATKGIQTNPSGDLDVWRIRSGVDGGTIEVAVRRDLGQAVFVTDVADEGGQFMTDLQFRKLGDFRTDPAVDRRISDNVVITIAGTALLLVGLAMATSAPGVERVSSVSVSRTENSE